MRLLTLYISTFVALLLVSDFASSTDLVNVDEQVAMDSEKDPYEIFPPNISGLTLLKVTQVTRNNDIALGGGLTEVIKGIPEKSTGCTIDSFEISIGGPSAYLEFPLRYLPFSSGFFRKDQSYWIMTTSQPEYGICHPQLIGALVYNHPYASIFHKLIDTNWLRHRPHYSPTGYTVNYIKSDTSDQLNVEVLKTQKVRKWIKDFNGKPVLDFPYQLSGFSFGKARNLIESIELLNLYKARINPDALVLRVKFEEELKEGNQYGIGAGSIVISRVYDAETGQLLAEYIPNKYQALFDTVTTKMAYSANMKLTDKSPKGKIEKTVMIFDPDTGILKSTETLYEKMVRNN